MLTKKNGGETLPKCSIDREKGAVILAMRGPGGERVTLTTTGRGAQALAVNLAAAAMADEEFETGFEIAGELEAKERRKHG